MNKPTRQIEIMAPAGSFDSLVAALDAGANSVYFGIEQLNMRAKAANNFKTTDLPKIVEMCGEKNVKTYLTLNTILYDHDLNLMKQICDNAKSVGVTAVIASDLAAITYANSIGLEVHISTQLNVTNIEEVKFFSKFADVIVLARELTFKQVKHIYDEIEKQDIRGPKGNLTELELFAHGALCVAVSGKCYMSLATNNSSANRGACTQNCRRKYRVTDEETGQELVIDNKYIMSPKDLCTIGFIDKVVDSGVVVLKLEGRGRSPDYVATVTKVYREAVDAYLAGEYKQDKIDAWTKQLETVYNRGFWHGGYYLGKKLGEWSGAYGSQATKENILLGRATTYFVKAKVAEFLMETKEVSVGDDILITGPTTGVIRMTINELRVDGEPKEKALKGDALTIPLDKRVRRNDKLFIVKDRSNG